MDLEQELYGRSDEDRLIASLGISRNEADKMRRLSDETMAVFADQLVESQRRERALRNPEPAVWRGSQNWEL